MCKYKETAVHLFPKEFVPKFDTDELYDFITKNLSRQLIDHIYGILSREKEIVVSQSELMTRDFAPTNSVEYRVQINWQPLVRCRECKHFGSLIGEDGERNFCLNNQRYIDDDWFCGDGDRKNANDK